MSFQIAQVDSAQMGWIYIDHDDIGLHIPLGNLLHDQTAAHTVGGQDDLVFCLLRIHGESRIKSGFQTGFQDEVAHKGVLLKSDQTLIFQSGQGNRATTGQRVVICTHGNQPVIRERNDGQAVQIIIGTVTVKCQIKCAVEQVLIDQNRALGGDVQLDRGVTLLELDENIRNIVL